MGGGGTEAFPDIGEHCRFDDCNQLDFLPFTCSSCLKVFCLEHRSQRSHACPRSDHGNRTVAVCEICSASVEKEESGEDDKEALARHKKSGTCDASKKRKPRCPVPRCKETLTFSNRSTCRVCRFDVCLRHRFPADHSCRMAKLTAKTRGLGCRDETQGVVASSPSINAF